MFYIQLGLVAAMFVGLTAQLIYGSESLLEASWLDPVFWGLIIGAVAVAALDRFYCAVIHCPLRRLLKGRPRSICPGAPCEDAA